MIDNEILQRALEWSDYAKGIRIFLDTDVSSIKNGELREAILLDEKKQGLTPRYYRGRKRKTWYDTGSNSIHVILSNIDNARELDRLILNEILLRRGLDGLVGDTTMNLIANAVFNGQDVQTQKTFLSYVLGRMNSESDHIAAGKLYLRAQANQYAKACTPRSKENAGKAWHSIVNKYIRPFTPKLFSFLSKETSLSQIIGAGIRAHAFYDSSAERMKEISSSSVRDEIIKLYDREMEGRPLDLGRYIHLGRPSDILLACAPWTRTCPVYLPLLSLYENQEDGRFERYITVVDDVKKDKHPFSLLQILHLKEDLDAPLAVFKSIKRDRGLVVMLPSKGGKSASDSEAEHFAVATSLQEINYTEKDGLRKSYGSGKWVNYIHSIYPKHDTGFLCWLSVPGLCSYIDPSFEEKWLKPAEKRLEMYFENLFETEGIKKTSAEEVKTILNTMSADDYIDIKSKLAKFLDLNEAGLPKVYSVYRDILESATKIVKEFENPKIIKQETIEFSVIGKNNIKHEMHSKAYRLAVEATMYMARKLNQHGIKTAIVSYMEAKKALEGGNNSISETPGKQLFRLSNETIYGYQSGDTIYLTPSGINPNTPIHEYAHLWAKVYERLHPTEWESLKEELKATPQWAEIANSASYSFIVNNENRLAGEVLATLIGNKGEELQIQAAKETLENESRKRASHASEVRKTVTKFKKLVTDMAVKDVFDAEGLERTGEVTLKVLQDFAKGRGLRITKEEGGRLAAMAETSLAGDKLVRVVDIIPDKSIYGKDEILSRIPPGGMTVFNEESKASVTVSRKAIRHSLQRLNETTSACAYNIDKIINNAKLLGTLPVANDEIGHTRAVMVFYCPARIGGELISARLIIKQLENQGRLIESLSFYNITPHKKREKSPVPNVKGFPGVYSDDTLSLCKIKDIIHNTQDYDKKLAGIETETSFYIENMDNLYLSNLDRHGVEHFQIDTLTHNAIVAHLDKITALYPKEPTTVTRKADGTIVRQYGEFEYVQLKGGFEYSKNLVLVEELDGETLQRKVLYSMSSDNYGEHPNGPYVRFWDNGNIRYYEDRSVRVGSDNEFESDMLFFTREGIVQEKIPGDYPVEPFLEDFTNEYMKTMTQKEDLEPNATADKIDSALLSTWFISLPLEDKMRVFGYYHNNPEVEESPIGFLKNAMDVEKLEKAYNIAVETPFDIPEVDDTAVRVSLEKELNTAFDSLSDASKEQIYRETVAAGIPGIEPSQSQTVAMQEGIDSIKNAIIVGFAEAYHENQRKISLLDAHLVPGLRRPVLEPWEKLTDIEKASAIVKAAQTVSLLDREYGLENIINKEVPDTEIIEMMARGGDEAFGRLFINYVDTHVKVRNGVAEIMNKDRFNAAISVGGSRVYGTLISSLAQAYHEKYKEEGISLEIAATWAHEVAVRIEETIGGANFFYPGRIDVKSLADAIGKEYDENDRQLVLDKLSDMLKPFAAADEITSEFSVTTLRKSILGISEGDGADVLEAYVRQGFGEVSPMSVDEVKNKIETLASECKVVLCLDNSTTEQRPFNELDVCLDIIGMTGMAGFNDTILVKEKTIAGGTMYTVADSLLLSAVVSVFNACLDKNGDLISYSDANQDVHVCYANAGAVYSVTTKNWGKEGSQPQSETNYTTQLIVDAFERIKKELPNKTLNQLQEQVEILQKIESPLRHFSIKAQSETTPQSLYRVSDMLERFDALKSEVSQQMSKELKRFSNTIHLVADNAPNMNLFELEGALSKISVVGPRFLEICEKNTGVPDAFNLAKDFKLTLTNLETAVKQAEKDYKQYLERGERTNNTLWDRLLGRTFTPHFALPTKEEIEEFDIATEPMRYVQDSFMLFASSIDPHIDVSSIFNSFLENNQVTVEAAEQEYVAESKSISLGELTSLPLDYKRQLEMTGRIDGPVCLLNPGGEDILVCVQKDGDSLISMRSDDIMSAIDKISSQEEPMFSVNVDGQHYQMRKDNFNSFKYGHGAYAVNAETGEKAYLIFDVKEKKVVKTEKFETVLSKKLQEEKAKADKVIAQSIGRKTETPVQKRGSGMKKS